MAFIIKKSDLTQETAKEYTHEETGIAIKFRSVTNPKFQRAFRLIYSRNDELKLEEQQDEQEQQQELNQELKQDPTLKMEAVLLTAENLSNVDTSELTVDEALAYVVGEHLIGDWNIMLEDEGEPEKLAVSGENFLGVFRNLDNAGEFLTWCMESANQATESIKKQVNAVVKKPSNAGNGSKATKT